MECIQRWCCKIRRSMAETCWTAPWKRHATTGINHSVFILACSQSIAQLFDAISLILPQSALYPVFATLPFPDPTNPTLTTTYVAQTAIHNSLSVLEQLIALLEAYEDQYLKKEVEKRRTRLGASPLEKLTKEVGMEIWATSRVRTIYLIIRALISIFVCSSLGSTTKFSYIPAREMIYDARRSLSFSDTRSAICMRYQNRTRAPLRKLRR